MFALFIIGMLALVAWKVSQEFPNLKTIVEEAIQQSSINNLSPSERCQEMVTRFEQPWVSWDPDEDDLSLSSSVVNAFGYGKEVYGAMEMEIAGDQIRIFDWRFKVREGKFELDFFQTVVAIQPEQLDLPPFYIRPRNSLTGHHQKRFAPVNTSTALEVAFDVESMIPHRVVGLFQSKIGSEQLVPFVSGRDWTIEWTGDCLIVYRSNQIVPPGQIQDFALEVTELLELLKSAPEEVDAMMKSFVESSLATTS